jgi:hypothetical protein
VWYCVGVIEKGAPPPARPESTRASLAEIAVAFERYAEGRRAMNLSPEQIRADLAGLCRLADRLQLEVADRAVKLAACGEDEWDLEDSPHLWIKANCKTTGGAAWNALVVGEQAGHLPASVAALRRGEIGFAALALIAGTAEWLQSSTGAAAFDETHLLARAKERSLAQLRRDCEHVRHAADPRHFEEDQVRQVEERFLQLTGAEGGGLWLRGYLDGEGGAALRGALDPLSRPDGPHDPRDQQLRQADALLELCGHVLDQGWLPQHGGQRPQLQVTVSLDTLTDREGSPAAVLQRGGLVAAETARRLGCDAQVSRVVFGAASQVLDVGRATRVPAAATRRAVLARDGGCVWPGCGRPASWSEIHHLHHWAHGGATDVGNLAAICRRHHWMCHEGGWRLARTAEGVVLIPPVLAIGGVLGRRAREPDRVPTG